MGLLTRLKWDGGRVRGAASERDTTEDTSSAYARRLTNNQRRLRRDARARFGTADHDDQEPMTQAQAKYLKRLALQAGETFDPKVSKQEASERINDLLHRIRAQA